LEDSNRKVDNTTVTPNPVEFVQIKILWQHFSVQVSLFYVFYSYLTYSRIKWRRTNKLLYLL